MAVEPAAERDAATAAVARYKSLLQGFIDRRPSGMRGRLARALGKHKSFITQITSPAYQAPIPAGDVPTIVSVCHLSPEEREAFLEAYRLAHPARAKRAKIGVNEAHEVRIALPPFRTAATARHVEAMIVDFAARVIKLAQQAETTVPEVSPNAMETRR